ncbi:caspase-1-like [Acipenser oxyrinchus oxyrinchus]|uniref:Caspase-1-like n=1 Tax=Acipenser oxyrinchus oxyrinchus TaxID=40147 RepID=A0AAD8CKU5_ACIOX|nr:caspase-1-like [Acipenser oxyrinchus oxyrinchus]
MAEASTARNSKFIKKADRKRQHAMPVQIDKLAFEYIEANKAELVVLLSEDPARILEKACSKNLVTPAECHWLRTSKYPRDKQMCQMVELISHKKKSLQFLQILAEVYGKEYQKKYKWITSLFLDIPGLKSTKDGSPREENNCFVKPCPPETINNIFESHAGEIYPISNKTDRTRLALIINNINFTYQKKRLGSEVDNGAMKKLLEALDYQVEGHADLSAEEMETKLTEFSRRVEHKTSDSTFIVLMSHGTEEGICGVNYDQEHDPQDILPINTISRTFNNKCSLNLVGKPKIFIIQALNDGYVMIPNLQGDCHQQPEYDTDGPLNKFHRESDLIFFCSTTPENKSYRNPKTGALFIQTLVDIFRKESWNCHIEDLFKKVQRSFVNFPSQLPCRERATLLKDFYLFPGH